VEPNDYRETYRENDHAAAVVRVAALWSGRGIRGRHVGQGQHMGLLAYVCRHHTRGTARPPFHCIMGTAHLNDTIGGPHVWDQDLGTLDAAAFCTAAPLTGHLAKPALRVANRPDEFGTAVTVPQHRQVRGPLTCHWAANALVMKGK